MDISVNHLDLKKTFECGQCFRWEEDGNGGYYGTVSGEAAHLTHCGGILHIDSRLPEDFWMNYFDLYADYDSLSDGFRGRSRFLDECIDFGRGIRLLNQEPWEALCSFIISQCNNIPRIKKIITGLCTLYGDRVEYENYVNYSFPAPEHLAGLKPEGLASLHCGYRAPYIIAAAKAVTDGSIDLEALKRTDFNTTVRELCKLYGVGKKVANCAALFGLGHKEGFPVDTWMKKALREYFPPDFRPESLGEYAGLAQQYIFYYSRENRIE